MDFKFYWSPSETPSPISESEPKEKYGYNPLDCLLMDDGGLSKNSTLEWIGEALRNIKDIKDIKEEKIENYYWGREDWAADINETSVMIHSIHDESVKQEIQIDSFEIILFKWKEFLLKANLQKEKFKI